MINTQYAIDAPGFKSARTELAQHGRILLKEFFEVDLAKEILDCLSSRTPWEMVYREQNENRILNRDQRKNCNSATLQELQTRINEEAKSGYQFCFDRYPMLDAYLRGDKTAPQLNKMLDQVNSPDFLNYCRQLTGDSQIRKVELQATRYQSGSFLKEHDDHANIKDDRRYACVFSFTEEWQADWGGILQFTDQGQIIDSFHPLFNSLALFKVPQTHQVSYVAPFATGARYSLTGWMRAD